jgi:hypothetical protein
VIPISVDADGVNLDKLDEKWSFEL